MEPRSDCSEELRPRLRTDICLDYEMDSHELQIGQNKKKNTERQLSKLTGYETSFDQGCPVSCRDQIHFGTRHGGTITTKVRSDCCGAT